MAPEHDPTVDRVSDKAIAARVHQLRPVARMGERCQGVAQVQEAPRREDEAGDHEREASSRVAVENGPT